MKKMMGLLLAMFVSVQAFATTNVEKVASLSGELSIMKIQLEQAEAEQKSSAIKLVVSAGLAAFLGIKSHKISNSGGSDIGQMYAKGLGMAGYAVTAIPTIYAGVQAYTLVVNTKAIPELKAAITQKQIELDAAKKVLESLE